VTLQWAILEQVSAEKEIYLVMDNAGGHRRMKEANREYLGTAVRKAQYGTTFSVF